MRMAADDDIGRLVEFLDDIDDRAGDAGALVVIARGKAAFVDKHHDGFDPLGVQFRHEGIHGLSFVLEREAGNA